MCRVAHYYRSCCGNVIQTLQAPPQRLRPRLAVTLAAQEAAQTGDAANASRKVGGVVGGTGLRLVNIINAFHWASSKYAVQGTSGCSRPSLFK